MSEHNSEPHSHLSRRSPNTKPNTGSNPQGSQTSSQLDGLETYITPSQASSQHYQQQAFNFGQNLPNKRPTLSVTSNASRKRANKSDNQGYQQSSDSFNDDPMNKPNRSSSKSINVRPNNKFINQRQNLVQKQRSIRSLQRMQIKKPTLKSAFQQIYNSNKGTPYGASYGTSYGTSYTVNYLNPNSIMSKVAFQNITEAKMQFESGQDDFSYQKEQKSKTETRQVMGPNNSRKVYYQDQMFDNNHQQKDCCCQFLGNQKKN